MKSDVTVFQKSRMPLYLQVAKLMRHQIESQAWRYGEQIPTLDELERKYQVSRITLRAALGQLEELGIVRRTRGLGTFVAKDLSQERWFKLPTTLAELVEAVAELKIRLLPVEAGADMPLVPAFPCGEVGPSYRRLLRVHYHDEQPYCLISVHVDRDLFDAAPQDFSSKPIIPQLVALRGVRIEQARQIVRITVADETTARHLDIGVGDPVAHVCRAIVDDRDRIIYYADIQYPAQMFQIEMDLLAEAAPKRPRVKPIATRKA
jgi:GntR family transcriptional regulator